MVLSLRTKPDDVEDSTDNIETEPGDYIPDFAAREALIAEWDELRRSRIPVRYFTPTATGILMIAPLEVLQDLLQSCKKEPDVFFDGVMERLNGDGFGVMENYVLGDGMVTIPGLYTENETPCIIAGGSRLNYISLGIGYAFSLCDARLAFKPLRSADPNERRLQLHWLSPSGFRFFDSYFHENPLQHAGLNAENTKTWGDKFRDRRGQSRIKTGHVITIRRDNPADLPDWDMLEMQWDLLRVGAIAGAKLDTMDDGTDWLHHEDIVDDIEFLQLDQEQ
ncbi:hypothetical protein BHE90_015065 [Fusarium euwallaceae]|uniref:Uncharacterized protein n=1 Tax=Fusarium euwallaceae TaxID=1147111 RepID=A0A430L478_9HYPO|nr:hypothetical protein BHE90_015065 [Fusarium euwallaceae]